MLLAAGLAALATMLALSPSSLAATRTGCAPGQGGSYWDPNTGRVTACAPRVRTAHKRKARLKPAKRRTPAAPEATATVKPPQGPPARADFSREEQAIAAIPGMPDARFWADSESEFRRALGDATGPWLALSAGGEDSAFGAGLLNGLSETGRRPEFAVVTGVSSGALLAPFVFIGPKRDEDLKREFTTISAPDIFEDRRTVESLLDTWPLREFVAKRITPQLLAEVAAEHKRGRRLIIVTTNIDAGRPVAWNMGAIASVGGDAALKLFRDVLVATSAIPGMFSPVMIDVEANGRGFPEMHVDGGLAATVYVAPDSMLLASSARRLPTSQLTLILNSKLAADFAKTDRHILGVLGRSLSIGVKRATRSAAILIAAAARRSGAEFNIAFVDQKFDFPSRGLFDQDYMKALYEAGLRQGRSDEPFRHDLPETTASQAAAPAPPPAE
jgi:predicted acylesterase/phospholipase RssA